MDLSSENVSNDVQELLRCCETLFGHVANNELSRNECRLIFHYAEELEDLLEAHCGPPET